MKLACPERHINIFLIRTNYKKFQPACHLRTNWYRTTPYRKNLRPPIFYKIFSYAHPKEMAIKS